MTAGLFSSSHTATPSLLYSFRLSQGKGWVSLIKSWIYGPLGGGGQAGSITCTLGPSRAWVKVKVRMTRRWVRWVCLCCLSQNKTVGSRRKGRIIAARSFRLLRLTQSTAQARRCCMISITVLCSHLNTGQQPCEISAWRDGQRSVEMKQWFTKQWNGSFPLLLTNSIQWPRV